MEDAVKIEIMDFKPTYVEIKFISNDHKVRLGKQYFKKRMTGGFYEVVNKDKIPTVL